MQLWSPNAFNTFTENCGTYTNMLRASQIETTDKVVLTLEMSGETALERFLGCFVISVMPTEGLQEALLSLGDIYKFHSDSARYRPLPQPTISRRAIGKVVRKSERPQLVITE